MQDSRINYVVVGAFVSAMIVAMVVVISILAGRTGSSDNYDDEVTIKQDPSENTPAALGSAVNLVIND